MNAPGKIQVSDIINKKLSKNSRKQNFLFVIIFLVLTAATVFLLLGVVFGGTIVVGDSMLPSFSDGDLAVYFRLEKEYEKDDIVIFRLQNSEQYLLKRIVATEGDVVDVDQESGLLTINDNLLVDAYAFEDGISYPLVIGKNEVFVLGDNRSVSNDSRDKNIGAIPYDAIFGRVITMLRVFWNG